VLGKMPQKTYHFTTPPAVARPLALPAGVTVRAVLDRVLRLVDVGSKRFLTNKVRAAVPPALPPALPSGSGPCRCLWLRN